jgi:cytochrome P450
MTSRTLDAPISANLAHKTAPGPKGCFVFGSLSEMRRDALSFLSRTAQQYGDVIQLDLVEKMHLLNHPDHVQRVLQDNHTNYTKGFFYERLKVLVGNGLLTSNGDFWLRQRRIASPAFHKERLASLQGAMHKRTVAMLDEWQKHIDSGETFDVAAEMMRLTLGIAGDTLFGVDLLGESESVGEAASDALEILNIRGNSLFLIPTAIPTAQNRRLMRAVKTLDDVVNGVIRDRHAHSKISGGEPKHDLLQMLMDAVDGDTGERMNDEQLRDEVMTLLLAGHETTAQALSWTWYLLSKHPAVERKLRAEVSAALGSRDVVVEDLPKLVFTEMVVKEALRLYPPAWLFSRTAKDDDVIGGYPIAKGSTVMLSPWVMHRNPQFWENPDAFDPERFSEEESKKRPRFAWFPFAAGPRMCIGWHFAMMELVTCVATIVQRTRLTLAPGFEPEPEPTITLRPADGVKMTAKRA